MTLHNEWLTYDEEGHTYSLYVSRPLGVDKPLPAVIVLQEVWGVDAHIRDVTERIAKAGYLAVAPDLYAENGVRPELLSEERIARVRAFLHRAPQAFRGAEARAAAVAELPAEEQSIVGPSADALLGSFGRIAELQETVRAAYRFLQRFAHSSGRTASVGFCMGGALSAALAAAEPGLAGAVVFYGRLAPEMADGIACPVLGFFGGLDEGVNALIPPFAEAMQAQGKAFEQHVYDGVKHAFFNDTGAGYDVNAARDAWTRTLAFLNGTMSS